MNDFDGRVVLITGGASGIGEGMACAFAEAGARIAIADVDEGRGAEVVEKLSRQFREAMFVALDVTDRAAWRRALDEIEARWGPVDILCNNAGASALNMAISTLSPETWDRSVQLNLTSVYNGVAAVVDSMRARGGGHIVNTASVAGLIANIPHAAAYTATKFGVVGLSETLAVELAPDGIGMTIVCPGAVRTSLWKTSRSALGLPPADATREAASPSASPDALDPRLLGRLVREAVRTGQQYVITHEEHHGQIEARFEAIRQASTWTRQALRGDAADQRRVEC